MKIEVFGPGCARCAKTEEVIKTVLAELKREAEVVKITDINEMVERGVLFTPAVVVDGKKVCEGRIPTAAMVKDWLI
ncbi:MAG TPA: thioredoxin family protein [Elusimicrobia bacterium]|nr:thioredoxin family protein [Elusimicrobiota bacterium]HBT60594.1 thioredoxin family protein [Elusimicrobiota bacterium]